MTTFHDDFERLASFPQPGTTTSERLRFYFLLAINLCRELVQQVWRFKHREQYGNEVELLDRSSVFYLSAEDVGMPLDVAWEEFMFKGPIYQINSPGGPMALDGLAVYRFRLESDFDRVYMPARVDWLSERFSRDYWDADESKFERNLAGLPDGSNIYAKELVIDLSALFSGDREQRYQTSLRVVRTPSHEHTTRLK